MHDPFKTAWGAEFRTLGPVASIRLKEKIPGVPVGAVGCRIQDPGTRGYWWWKTANFSHSVHTAPIIMLFIPGTPPENHPPTEACLALRTHSARWAPHVLVQCTKISFPWGGGGVCVYFLKSVRKGRFRNVWVKGGAGVGGHIFQHIATNGTMHRTEQCSKDH